ncbi:MAG: DUF2520 domain-containing protein [Proteobacteria bacterium]|nr:DUF2520 domain-containing protein [Pseudomonadota bacterium]
MTDTLFIIGAGAAGGSLAVALARSRYSLIGVFDPVHERAQMIAEAANTISHWEELPDSLKRTDIVLVAVPDPLVNEVAKNACNLGMYDASQTWLHVSGALPAAELSPLSGRVRGLGAFHPALVFAPGQITEIPPKICFAVDGDSETLAIARELAVELKGIAVNVPASVRPQYHAATVMASNYVMALLSEAQTVLFEAGLQADEIERLLTSLAVSAVGRAQKKGINASLSGPIRRGDLQTVERHLNALEDTPDVQEIYRLLGRATVRLAERIGKTDKTALKDIAKKLVGG